MGAITSVVNARSGPSASSVSGGSGQGVADPLGVWVDFTGNSYNDDTLAAGSDGSTFIGTVGADYTFMPGLLAGAAVSLEVADFSTNTVLSNTFLLGEYSHTAVTIAPYAAYQLNDIFSVSGAAGLTFGEADVQLNQTSDTAGLFRYFVSASGGANTIVNNFTLGGNVSILYMESSLDDYTTVNGQISRDNDTELGRVSVGGRVGYLIPTENEGVTAEPFFKAGYSYDWARTDTTVEVGQNAHPNDEDEFNVGAGLSLYSTYYGSGSIEYNRKLGRQNVTDQSLSLNYRMQF